MCVLGSIMKKEIMEEKKNNPEKFISIEDATKEENKNNGTFCLGVLAKSLEDMGIITAIEKNSSNDEEAQNASNTILQFITNGMIENLSCLVLFLILSMWLQELKNSQYHNIQLRISYVLRFIIQK